MESELASAEENVFGGACPFVLHQIIDFPGGEAAAKIVTEIFDSANVLKQPACTRSIGSGKPVEQRLG